MIKLVTANLGGKQSIKDLKSFIDFIKQNNPDIILMQEVIKKNNVDVLKQLKEVLNYPFAHFALKQDFSKDYGKGILQKEKLIEGLGIISNLQFKAEIFHLPMIFGEDRWPRIATKYWFKSFSICNLHFSKLEKSRRIAVKELPDADIYAGDFNMQPDELLKNFTYNNSYSFKRYLSYPSKNLTLDYILLKYGKFKELRIINGVSDHNGLFVEIINKLENIQ
jgi:endonuclease/exonuclease/phosphatase family metal-dependent hydrolase